MKDKSEVTVAVGRCGRCQIEKEVVSFFFDWRFASGKYSLCASCLNELQISCSPKKERMFFENIRDAIKIIKAWVNRNTKQS